MCASKTARGVSPRYTPRSNLANRANGHLFDNSLRLLEDAKILFKHKRFPSAAALAILSLEEFGKFVERFDIAFSSDREKPDKRLHFRKQKSISLYLLRISYFLAVADELKIELRFKPGQIIFVHDDPAAAKKLFQPYSEVFGGKADIMKMGKIMLMSELL